MPFLFCVSCASNNAVVQQIEKREAASAQARAAEAARAQAAARAKCGPTRASRMTGRSSSSKGDVNINQNAVVNFSLFANPDRIAYGSDAYYRQRRTGSTGGCVSTNNRNRYPTVGRDTRYRQQPIVRTTRPTRNTVGSYTGQQRRYDPGLVGRQGYSPGHRYTGGGILYNGAPRPVRR